MRIMRVSTSGVGGLPDCTVELPAGPIAAFAGVNGSGKSKLLACMLSPWTRSIPTARAGATAEVGVTFELDDCEAHALRAFSVAAAWGDSEIPTVFSYHTRNVPQVGLQNSTVPNFSVLHQFFHRSEFLSAHPSLDILFLPAERRLLDSGNTGIDLNQLDQAIAQQTTINARSSVQAYGRLDDSEFEQFARALCVASQLSDDPDDLGGPDDPQEVVSSRISWEEFVDTVNGLIAPKRLLPLTRSYPERLRIAAAEGEKHAVQELSSGERQALIIISRILRAGTGHSVVLIDEPDAYLHPHLSRRLVMALERAVGPNGQLVLATHSPTILDAIPASSIVRLSHGRAPELVSDESERLEVYRESGFRASALTQSDLLVVTEGESDLSLLPLLLPDLARAATRSAGGRSGVIQDVKRLHPFSLPVVGVVDADIFSPVLPGDVSGLVSVWPTADIEGLFLSSDISLEVMVDRRLAKAPFGSVDRLRSLLDDLIERQKPNVVAEIAQALLRQRFEIEWPTPRGDRPIERLIATAPPRRRVQKKIFAIAFKKLRARGVPIGTISGGWFGENGC